MTTEVAEIDSLEAAVMCALRAARELGTWDTPWYAYAPPGWERRVKNAPRDLVEEIGVYLTTLEPHPLFELCSKVDRWMRDDPGFADALIALSWRDNTPICFAEVFAHYENERRDGRA